MRGKKVWRVVRKGTPPWTTRLWRVVQGTGVPMGGGGQGGQSAPPDGLQGEKKGKRKEKKGKERKRKKEKGRKKERKRKKEKKGKKKGRRREKEEKGKRKGKE